MAPEPVTLRIPGLEPAPRLYLHDQVDDLVSRRIREERIWEPYETELLLQLLPTGGVFVDVGANIGYFSVLAGLRAGPGGAVFAVEPDPANHALLLANLALNGLAGLALAERAALSDAESQGRLYLSADNLGDHQVYPGDGERPSVPVRMLQGSEWLGALTRHLDLLKVDTQGSEYTVIAGLMPLLRGLDRPANLLIELTPYSLRLAGASGRQLIELLAGLAQAFWIVDHLEHRLVRSSATELARWCDDVDAVPGDRGFMNILVGPGQAGPGPARPGQARPGQARPGPGLEQGPG